MPELPEVEITARRLGASLAGAEVESALAPGMVALKSHRPAARRPRGRRDLRCAANREDARGRLRPRGGALGAGMRRLRGTAVHARPSDVGRPPAAVRQARLASRPHLASAGPARRRTRAAPARVRHQAARLGEAASRGRASTDDEMVATLGPEAWPAPPLDELAQRIDQPRHLHPMLRDQRVIAGHRPLMGRRDPLGGRSCRRSSRARTSTARRWTACMPRSTCSATRSITTRR